MSVCCWAIAVVGILHAIQAPMACAASSAPDAFLDAALARLGTELGVAVLFDRTLVMGVKVRNYRQDLLTDRLLAVLLRGTGLVAVRTASGAFVIRKSAAVPMVQPQATPLVAEILVSGHSSSNADLPRSPDDFQPNQVFSASRIDSSLAHTTGEFLSDQLSMNLAAPSVFGDFVRQSVESYVDFNGVGAEQTLLTIDGRRLPQIPGNSYFQPPDVGALAPGAVDRIETLG